MIQLKRGYLNLACPYLNPNSPSVLYSEARLENSQVVDRYGSQSQSKIIWHLLKEHTINGQQSFNTVSSGILKKLLSRHFSDVD